MRKVRGGRLLGGLRFAASHAADGLSDEQLVGRLAGQEDEAVLSALYDRYAATIYGTGLKLLGDRAMAEELVQEVFLKVWRSSRSFDPARGSFSPWLFRITRNAARDMHRTCERRPGRGADVDTVGLQDASPGPQEIVDDSWLSWRMSRALETLDAPHKEVIELAYFRGLSQREISRLTNTPLGTVKSRTSGALKRLRRELAPYGTSWEGPR